MAWETVKHNNNGGHKMTEKEAIKILQELSLERCGAWGFDCGNCDKCKVTKAYSMAIIALEKQIPYPLKPNKCKGGAIPVCGKCGGIMDLIQGDLDYCPNCGQKLLWEEKE